MESGATRGRASGRPARPAGASGRESRTATDTSVAIAALLAGHDAHRTADDALARTQGSIAHVVAETYSVLTRLPAPLRLDAKRAAALVAARFPSRMLALDHEDYRSALGVLASAGVSGGATYDGLIALTACKYSLELVSRDRRAVRTYERLGAEFRLLP